MPLPMIYRLALLLAVALAFLPAGQAQSSRADSASRTAATLDRTEAATQTSSMSNVSMEADYDLGRQQPISARAGGIGAYIIADTGLNYTSNPSLSNGGGRGDMYFVARGGAGIYPNIASGLYLDAHVFQDVYQYAQFSSLNFTRFNAGGGLDYVFESLGRLTASLRYDYDRYLDGDTLDEFYVNHSLKAGLSKEFQIRDDMAIQAGTQIGISLSAQPTIARRNEYDFWLGYRWRIANPIELQTYYVLSLYNYPNDGARVDVSNNVGGSLNFYLTRWARLSASANFGANNSTQSFYDYTVVNVGGLFGLDIRF
jgi:hypothetical protein